MSGKPAAKPPFTLAEQVTSSSYRIHYFDNAAQAQAWIAATRTRGMRRASDAYGRRLHGDVDHRGDFIEAPYAPIVNTNVLAVEPACRD